MALNALGGAFYHDANFSFENHIFVLITANQNVNIRFIASNSLEWP